MVDIFLLEILRGCTRALQNTLLVSTKIWDFANISLFPKILSLKSFGNSYTKFAILGITFRFTCG